MGAYSRELAIPRRLGREALSERRLRKAIAEHEFELHYQPRVCMHSQRIDGVEALLRWRMGDEGLRSPAEFLPELESSGLILELGDWILERALQDCRYWQRQGLPPLRTSVNISRLQLQRPGFARHLLQLAQPWATNSFGLDVEITEDAVLGNARADIKKLSLLRSAGIRVAIDDFGSGVSSLSTLCALPVDSLKIDNAFIGALPDSRAAQAMVWTIISLARGLGLTAIAEGVETQEQLEILRQMGCDQSQGYLHSRPVSRERIAQLLRDGKGWLAAASAPFDLDVDWDTQTGIRVNAF